MKKQEIPLDPKKLEVLDKVADFITKRDLGLIAVLTVESMRPLHFLGAQALLFFEPFLNMLVNDEKIRLFRESFEDNTYVDYFLERIENPPKEK